MEQNHVLTGTASEMRAQLIKELVVTHSDQIKDLPWKGNFFSDEPVFNLVDIYIWAETTSVTERLKAMYFMSLYGMGIDEPVTVAELAEYIEVAHDAGKITTKQMIMYKVQIIKWIPLRYPMFPGTSVKIAETGECGLVTSGGSHAGEPVVVNMGSNTTVPRIKFDDHTELRMRTFINPDLVAE